MIEKRIKKILELIFLITTRQLYFLGRNWYLMTYEPYLTIKEIWEKRDKSQIFLIFLSALTPIMVYVVARIIYDLIKYNQLLFMTGKVFEYMVVIQILIIGYLGYWIVKVIRDQ
jgi:hypothetical protein